MDASIHIVQQNQPAQQINVNEEPAHAIGIVSETPSIHISMQAPKAYQIGLTDEAANTLGIVVTPCGNARLTMGTVAFWEAHRDYIPKRGEIVVYSDRRVIDGVPYPGIKIGDGRAFGIDLPFAGDDGSRIIMDILNDHIHDNARHIVPGERENWNNKVSCSIDGERLILEGMEFNA